MKKEIKLFSYTQIHKPAFVEHLKEHPEDFQNLRDIVAYTARVSNPGNQMNFLTSDKLIHFLLKHKHWSPFEMVDVTLDVPVARDIGRQVLRHTFSPQEFSQRYANPLDDPEWFQLREARLQDTKNRQNSIEINDPQLAAQWEQYQMNVIDAAESAYKWAISKKIALECARVVLPEGLTMSRMFLKNNLRGWIHYTQIRTGVETQKEHRELALACAEAIQEVFPSILEFVS